MKKYTALALFMTLIAAVISACKPVHVSPAAITSGNSISGLARIGHTLPCSGMPVIIGTPLASITITPQPTPTSTAVPALAGAKVELLDAGSNVIAVTYTASNGAYKFTGLADGTYSVKCLYAGYDWDTICCLAVNGMLDTTAPDFTMIYANPPGTLEVMFKPSVAYTDAVAILAAYNCTDDTYLGGSLYEPSHWLFAFFPVDKTLSEMSAILKADPNISYVGYSNYYCIQ